MFSQVFVCPQGGMVGIFGPKSLSGGGVVGIPRGLGIRRVGIPREEVGIPDTYPLSHIDI